MDFILNIDLPILIQTIGYLGIFFIIFAESGLFFGFFLPGDTLLFTAGLLASQGYFNIALLILLIVSGAVLGDQIGYFFGKKFGPKIFNRDESLFFKKKYITEAENFYKKHGKKTIILARFLPVIRTFIPILAGVGKMHYRTFVTYNIMGGLFWGVSITLSGYFLGQQIPNVDTYLIPILLLIVFVSMLPTFLSFIYSKIKERNVGK
ncbi:MAG: VTT domain-containing protein [Patescibacteria group bacterium]